MGGTHTTTVVANAHKEPIWVKIDGDRSLHDFQPANPGVLVNPSGILFENNILIFR